MAYKKRFDELKAELTSKEKEIEQLKANQGEGKGEEMEKVLARSKELEEQVLGLEARLKEAKVVQASKKPEPAPAPISKKVVRS